MKLLLAVSEELGVKIGRTSMKLRNPKNQPPEWAKQLFIEKPHEPQFAQLDEETVGALLPIKLQAKCLMCHGTKETLVPGVPEQLAKLYPERPGHWVRGRKLTRLVLGRSPHEIRQGK